MSHLFIVYSGRVLEPTPIGSSDVGAPSNESAPQGALRLDQGSLAFETSVCPCVFNPVKKKELAQYGCADVELCHPTQ